MSHSFHIHFLTELDRTSDAVNSASNIMPELDSVLDQLRSVLDNPEETEEINSDQQGQ